MSGRLGREFFSRAPVECARELIGCVLFRGVRRGVIVEAEAYDAEDDPACHTASRPSARDFVARHPAGTAYVYFNYGMHWMLNVLVKGGRRGFVLLRAVEPVAGIGWMARARGTRVLAELCSGPGKLAKAFGITGRHHGADMCASGELGFLPGGAVEEVWSGPRVGISSGRELPWRFALAGNPHVSRPRPKA